MNEQDVDKTGMTGIDEAMLSRGWITFRNAADKMLVSVSSIYRLVDDGKLEWQKAAGKKYVSIQSCLDYLGPDAAKALGLSPKSLPPVQVVE